MDRPWAYKATMVASNPSGTAGSDRRDREIDGTTYILLSSCSHFLN